MGRQSFPRASSKRIPTHTQRGSVLLYIVAAVVLAGFLGAGIATLTSTSATGELNYNTATRARLLAQSGLDYARSALEAEDPDLRNAFRSGTISDTPFQMEKGRFILTVAQDPNQADLYHITSEGRVETGSLLESGFVVTGEALVSGGGGAQTIVFSEHDIQIYLLLLPTGFIQEEQTPDSPGYTYDGSQLVLYNAQGQELVTITGSDTLRHSRLLGSLGTGYAFFEGGGVIDQGESLQFAFPEGSAYTELTINLAGYDPGEKAEIEFANSSTGFTETTQITAGDVSGGSATVTSSEPFTAFTITNTATGNTKLFCLTGIEVR
ncbi:MAG TPA: hypothetical protein VKO20_08520 [Desulfosalsimonadaceae bacterium]|nr:hypothetical protein [Desulfosalsimonadaceae bacterium]